MKQVSNYQETSFGATFKYYMRNIDLVEEDKKVLKAANKCFG